LSGCFELSPCQKEDDIMANQIQPNIVFVLCDNVGWGDFSCYGGSIPTPRIDKLAREGIRFNNYTVEAQCTPTRSAILTGRQSVRCGTYTVIPGRGELGLNCRTALGRGLRDVNVG
jgi:arylsulfatase A-like enzyme